MAGNVKGGLKAAQTNKSLYGEDYYQRIGAAGGKLAPGPFAADRELASRASKIGGAIGGKLSKRGPVFVKDESDFGEGFFAPSWKDKILRRFR